VPSPADAPSLSHVVQSIAVGVDTGKTTYLIGLNKRGAIALRVKVLQSQIARRLANIPRCLIGLEAGSDAAHHIAAKSRRDAEAIAKALQRPTVNFVSIKTPEQRNLLSLHAWARALLASAPL
jgi:transposase